MRDFVSNRVKGLEESPTVALMGLIKKLRSEGHDVINLAGGEPNFNTPQRIIDEAYRSMNDGFTSYVQSEGIPALRRKISEKLFHENNINIDPEKGIIVTASTKLALHISLLTFLEQGDEVLYFEPAWVSYKPLIEITGANAVPIPLRYEENFEITEEILQSYTNAKTKALLINSPNNPTGRVCTEKEIYAIVRHVRKHDLLVMSDEIYEKIIFDNNKHNSLGSYKEICDKVITLNGFSKSYAMAGWRLGYAAAAPHLIKEMLKVQQHIVTCATSFVQSAGVTAFECEDEVRAMTEEYKRRRDFVVQALNTIPGVECRYPEGAFYVFPRISYKNMNSFELSKYILENAKVAVAPGEVFGGGGSNCIRMPFAASMEDLQKAVEQIRKALT